MARRIGWIAHAMAYVGQAPGAALLFVAALGLAVLRRLRATWSGEARRPASLKQHAAQALFGKGVHAGAR